MAKIMARLAACVAAPLLAGTAQWAAAQEPRSFDIVSIKLGMSADQVDALVKKNFKNVRELARFQYRDDQQRPTGVAKVQYCYDDGSGPDPQSACRSQLLTYFTKADSKLYGISRAESFTKAMSVDVLLNALDAKYGKLNYLPGGASNLYTQVATVEELMSGASTPRQRCGVNFETARSGCGAVFSVGFNRDSNGLSKGFQLELQDHAALHADILKQDQERKAAEQKRINDLKSSSKGPIL